MDQDPSFRKLVMLNLVPIAPSESSTELIWTKLQDRGFDIGLRSVQRDLVNCSRYFSLASRKEGQQLMWSRMWNPKFLEQPKMDGLSAFAYWLVERFMAPMLPPKLRGQFDPYFKQARLLLAAMDQQEFVAWDLKIMRGERGFNLEPEPLEPELYRVLYQALWEGKQLRIFGGDKGSGAGTSLDLHPLGLVFHQETAYLVYGSQDSQEVKKIDCHQISQAVLLNQPSQAPPGFELKGYVRSEAFGGLGEKREMSRAAPPYLNNLTNN